MPRILSVNSYHYRRGGADAVYLDHAALMESQGWENAWFAMKHPGNLPTPWSRHFVDEIQFGHEYSLKEKVVKASKVVYSFEARRRLRELLREFHPDVAHLHNIYHHLSPSILPVFAEHRVPVVMTAHDLKIVCPNNKMLVRGSVCERCRGHRYWNVVRMQCVQDSRAASLIVAAEAALHASLRSYQRHVDRIVVPSRFFIEKFVEWGWQREQLVHIPNYVVPPAAASAGTVGTPFLYLGRLSPEKGVETLIRAAAKAGVPLRIAGTGPLEAELRAAADATGAQAEFLGFLRGESLAREVQACRALVLPSECFENSPLSVLEGFAAGKPVIGAEIGGIPELVLQGQTGWLFRSGSIDSLAEALRTVADLPDSEVAQAGARARDMVLARFSREAYLDAILRLYRSLGVDVGLRPAAVSVK